jgi:phytoene dehydrogenase-like protein
MEKLTSSTGPRCNRGIETDVERKQTACVIGSGPNGLAAAIVLAQAGLSVDVFEAESTPGGACRTMELTLPGFLHDFGSAVHPLGAGSPFFSSLPLQEHGLDWIHSPAAIAHPLDHGAAVVLDRDLRNVKAALGADAAAWIRLVQPFVENWQELAPAVLRPVTFFPKHPLLMARFGLKALLSAKAIANRFQTERARSLFAGFAAHSFLALDEPLSGAFGMIFAITAHAVGWPVPRGGSQSITNSLCSYLSSLGGSVRTSSRIESLAEVAEYNLTLCDVTPRQLLRIAGPNFTDNYKRALEHFRYGPGVFKVDYALNAPIPWTNSDCSRAATVHLGGNFEEIAASESASRNGRIADRPFVLLAQPTLFDHARAPAGKHTAWAYCHVPNGSTVDVLSRIENQIERFAPGFRDCILARRVFTPAGLENMNANLVGGDVGGGAIDIGQFLFRPTWRTYATSASNIYICSASTPPGGGVHGMCGYHAARMALARRI